MHDMVTLNDGKNDLGGSVSFMVDFDLYRLAVASIPNNVLVQAVLLVLYLSM